MMSTAPHSAPASAPVPSAITSAVPVSFFVRKQNGVNKSVRALGCFNGVSQSLFASAVHSIGKDDERFASLLFFHYFVRRKVHRVVAQRAASASAVRTMAARTSSCRLREFRLTQRLERRFELLARRSEVLEQFDFVIEVNHKSLVLIFTQYVIEKSVARGALLVQHTPLAHARVHQQPQRERKIGVLREIGNRLRMAVLFQYELIFAQFVNQMSVFIPNRRDHTHHLDVHRDRRCLLLLVPRRRITQRQQSGRRQNPQFCPTAWFAP